MGSAEPPSARGQSCIAHNRKAAILVSKLWRPLKGYRMVFQVNLGSGAWSLCWTMPALRHPTRARVRSYVLPAIEKSPCWPGDSSDPCTVPDWNPKSTWGMARGFYVGEYKILVHRARVMSSVMRTIEKWQCLLGSGVFLLCWQYELPTRARVGSSASSTICQSQR